MALEKAAGAAALVWSVEAVAGWAGAVVAGVVGPDAICGLLLATPDSAFSAVLCAEISAMAGKLTFEHVKIVIKQDDAKHLSITEFVKGVFKPENARDGTSRC